MEKVKTVILRVKPGSKIYTYLEEQKNNYSVSSKIVVDALENYIDIIQGKKGVDESGHIYNQHEQLEIQEIKQLMKDVKRVNKRIESYIIDNIEGKKGNQDNGN